MATNASDVLIETIADWGVDTIFGLPGDGINGIMEALRVRQDRMRFVQVRHEESAAFMACAYAKYTGKLGVCLATSGPGAIHLLNGLYDAKLDGQPVLAITGMQFHDLTGTFTQQDVEVDKLFMDVAVYNERIMGPTHVEPVADLACRMALSHRGVAHITIPVDFQELAATKGRSKRNIPHHTSSVFAGQRYQPAEGELREAADVLNAGSKTVILAGRGALGAGDELEQVAERLAAPIVKPLLGKGCVPDDSPYTTGSIGLLGTAPSDDAMKACDTLLMVGTSFPYLEFYPKPEQARAVQIELDPQRIGLRYDVARGLIGDSRQVLAALLPMLDYRSDRRFLVEAQDAMKQWWKLMEESGTRSDQPMKPQVVAWELGQRLRDDAIISSDSGTITTWFARQIKVKRGQLFSLSGNLASMANGLPYTIAAQIAYPERQCVGFVGDGGFSMLMADFATAVKYRLPIKIIVVKNSVLGQIKWEQIAFLGNPEFGVDLQPIDFAGFARACGGSGFVIDDPRDCGRVLDEALATPGPTIVEAVVDPLEPPMPGKVTREQAAMVAKAILGGEKDGGKILQTILKDRVREMV